MRRMLLSLLVILGLAAGMGVSITGRIAAQVPDVVVVGKGTDAPSLDPHKTGALLAEIVFSNMYDTLIARDAALNLKPGLALSWRTVDPTTWELNLRRGVKFHNGEPFTAHAVKFSFERALDPKTKWARASVLRPIKSVAVVDDYTVRITTERPWPLFLPSIARHGWIVPPRYIEKDGDETMARRPVGTGPYRFVRWVKDDRLELEANAGYWGGRPRIGRVVIRVIPNESSRLAELLAGSVHLINLIPPELYGPIERSPRTRLVHGRSAGIFFIQYNLVSIARDRPLADRRVRQALNHAVDRRALISSIMHNAGVPVATFCVETDVGCDASIPGFPYDPERARVLLREAGHPDGFDMSIAATSGAYPGDRDLTLGVADQVSRVGVRARVVITEYGIFLRSLIDRKLPQDAAFVRNTGHVGYAGEIAFGAFHSRGIVSLWRSQEFDQMLETAWLTVDEAARRDLLRRTQLYFKDEAPGIPLFTAPNSNGLHRDLEWTPRPDALLTMFDASWRRR